MQLDFWFFVCVSFVMFTKLIMYAGCMILTLVTEC